MNGWSRVPSSDDARRPNVETNKTGEWNLKGSEQKKPRKIPAACVPICRNKWARSQSDVQSHLQPKKSHYESPVTRRAPSFSLGCLTTLI
ncbi:hypothetical protein BDP81DRAFT_120705 [Colletotrichum phormii]|uniref:Uncharacterized protein n=1 Tax=Colletotrichum phormii TaxID=359342 RepID=A0AAJ0E8X8_9PEZI|nr:uncharacterized protein BDP81DRAFT_120705 [Colletotrichum phormii]KAK1623339.1 hypothetical protein BDP81DRAFT_120705 [Colletotrichum phormii]